MKLISNAMNYQSFESNSNDQKCICVLDINIAHDSTSCIISDPVVESDNICDNTQIMLINDYHTELNQLKLIVQKLSAQVHEIIQRNEAKDMDKAFESSLLRVIFIMILTYCVIYAYLRFLDTPHAELSALVPTVGFNLSTWSLTCKLFIVYYLLCYLSVASRTSCSIYIYFILFVNFYRVKMVVYDNNQT